MFALESAMDELAVAARHRPGRAADPQRARPRTPSGTSPGRAGTSSSACAPAPSGSAGPGATCGPGMRTEGRWLVGTGVAAATYPTRRRKAQCRISRRRPTAGTASRSTARTSAPAPGRRCPRSPPTRSGVPTGRRRAAHRRQPAAAGRRRRRLDRARLLGVGDRAHRPRPAPPAGRRVRRSGAGRRPHRRRRGGRRGAAREDALDARVRRPLRRGAGRPGHRRGAGAAGHQRVRRRARS